MNNFCMYCTGGCKDDIKICEDKYCPFYQDRRANLPHQNKKGEQK